MKTNYGDAVRVEWVDSMGSGGWKETPKQIDMRCVSVGFFVHQAKDRVVIAQNYAHDKDPNRITYGDHMTIPRCAVKRIQVLQRNAANMKDSK